MNTNKKLRIALIGAGGIGKRWAKTIANSKEAKLSVVCDSNLSKARAIAEQYGDSRAVTDWTHENHFKEVDAAIIALPHVFLAPASQFFLKNKKHVLCEKPGGVHPDEIKKTITIASESGARYMIGFNHRFHDGFKKARRLFDKGAIGDILFIRARYGFGGRIGYEKEWRFNKKISGGGELIDQGVHMIDMVRWFLDDVSEVQGFTEDTFWKGGVDDNTFLVLKNKKKQVASIHVSWTQWNPMHNFEIYGTKGYLTVDGLGKKYGVIERLIFGKRNKNFTADEKVIICNTDADRSLTLMLQEFVSAVKEKRESVPSGRDGLETLKIVHEIYSENKK